MTFKKMFRRKRSIVKPNQVVVEDLSKDLVPAIGSSRFAVILHNLLSPQECSELIHRSEEEGFDDALFQGPWKHRRSCGRCVVDDAVLADFIYARIRNTLRGTALGEDMARAAWMMGDGDGAGNASAIGMNERIRFLKHGPGPHKELLFVRGPEREGGASYVTVQLYLNEKFKGGETRFLCGQGHYDVQPRAGSALLFDHNISHQESRVTSGIKYSVWAHVMFALP